MTNAIKDLLDAKRLKPLPGTLIARIDKVQSRGRIILPTTAQYESSTATIEVVGADLPEYLKPGTRILPHESSGREVYGDDTVRYVLYALKDIQAAFVNPTEAELAEFFGGLA